ncbi:hypothetical protein GCM10010289_58160 [Streptomyces violascens]|nr:hypothetical protein GCM10010289_58160 [Streptomyces violascens]
MRQEIASRACGDGALGISSLIRGRTSTGADVGPFVRSGFVWVRSLLPGPSARLLLDDRHRAARNGQARPPELRMERASGAPGCAAVTGPVRTIGVPGGAGSETWWSFVHARLSPLPETSPLALLRSGNRMMQSTKVQE